MIEFCIDLLKRKGKLSRNYVYDINDMRFIIRFVEFAYFYNNLILSKLNIKWPRKLIHKLLNQNVHFITELLN